MNTAPSPTQDAQALLATPVGQPGSGGLRYAAAMSCFNAGLISAAMLEIYRHCSKFDAEDPIGWARYQGVDPPAFATSDTR